MTSFNPVYKKGLVAGLAILALFYSLTACGGGGVTNQPPVGQLTAALFTGPADLSGPVGTKIRFTATFSDPDGGSVQATLNFGDGSTSIVPNSGDSIIHTYTAAGSYQPKLLLQDDDNTPVVTLFVNNDNSYRIDIENRAPVAIIVANPAAGPKPLSVSFSGLNSYDPDGGNILNYFWTFNSGGPNCPITTTDQTGATASFIYETEGDFYACLRVTDDEGQTSFATQLIRVRDRVPPTPILRASPTSGITPLVVTFNGGDSYDPDNGTSAGFGITSYEWKFEAQATDQCPTFVQDAAGAVTQHTYVNNGPRAVNFTAILRVRDDDTPVAQIACDSVTITVQPNPPPIANIAANPTRGPVPLTVSVDGSASYDPDGGAIVFFEWDFVSDSACSTFTRDQTGATAQWTYNTAGTWFICLRVTDDEGLTSTTVQQINAGGNPPVAVLNAHPTWSNDSPLTVFFDGRSSFDPEGLNLVSYVWDFGDTSPTQSGATAQHTYNCPDPQIGTGGCTWTATLTVTDQEGLQNTAAQVIVISANPAPVAVVTATPNSGTAPLQVTFDASGSHDPDPTNVITSYAWAPASVAGCTTPSGTATFTFSCTFDTNGIWTITVTVTDDEGLTDTNSVQVFIGFNPPPVAVFSATPSNGPQPLTVSFDATGSFDPDGGALTSYEWDFTTGGSSFAPGNATAVFVYTCPSSPPCTFTSALRVTDDDAPAAGPRTGTATQTIYVGGRAPVAIINASPTWSNHSPMTVSFNGSSSFDPDGLPLVSYTWNFGDGSPAQTGATASHTYYAVPGPNCSSVTPPNCTWNPTLTVVDKEGLSNTATQTIIISNNPAPIAILTATPTWGGNPLNVTFDGTASHDPDPTNILTYSWSPSVGGCTTPSTSIATFSCLFNVDGAHTVTLTVTDDEALIDSATVTIFVNLNPPPVAVITAPATTCMLAGPANSCVLTFHGGNSFDPDNGTDPGAGITLYEWDTTGDFVIDSIGSTVTETYFAPGPVTVTLRVTDDDFNVSGGPFVDIETIVVTILGNPDPVAMVSCQPTFGIAAFSFTCTGVESHDPDATNVITLYEWDICDGSGSAPPCTAGNVSPTSGTGVIYTATFDSAASGVYTVNLQVTDDEGNTDTEQAILNVGPNPPPIAVATATPSFCTAPCDVTLDGGDSYDPDVTNTIVAYSWTVSGPDTNFDPASSTSSSFVVHFNPAANGVYTADLEVTDDEGLTDTVSVSIYINLNPPPVAVLNAPATTCMIAGVSNSCVLTFNGQKSYDPDEGLPPSDGQGITNYEWDPDGDGFFNSALDGSTTITWTYGLADVGAVPVALRVTDNDGLTNTTVMWVTILGNPDPVAVASCRPTWGDAPLAIECTGVASYDPDETNIITNYDWDFGDSAIGNGILVSHIYTAAGVYTVTLTVTDDEGLVDSEFVVINVNPNPPPIAVATATPSFCTAPCDVTLDGSDSFDPDDTDVITAYSWTISPTTNVEPDSSTSSSWVAHFDSNAAGVYVADLEVTDDEGLTDTVSVSIYINLNPPPVAVLNAPATTCMIAGVSNSCVLTFNGQKSYDPDEGLPPSDGQGITNYEWDPDGDGFFNSALDGSTTITWTYGLADVGAVPVALRVTDNDGLTNTTVMWVTILGNPDPVAVVTCAPTYGFAPLSVECTGIGSYDPDQTNIITNYDWDFGDTGTGTGILVSHVYTAASIYTVTLTVTDDEGNTDSEFVVINVGPNPPPIAVATATPSFCTAPCDVTLDGSGSFDPDDTDVITAYSWTVSGVGGNFTPSTSTDVSFVVHFNSDAAGVYVADLEVTDDDGLTDTVSVSIYINTNPPPVAVIEAPATTCMIYGVSNTCTLTFNGGSSYDPDEGMPPSDGQGITLYEWDADGDAAFDLTGATITWTYGAPDVGLVPVTLRVTDNETPTALTDTETIWVTILGNPDPVAAISCTPTYGTAPFSVTCHGADSYDPDATNIITNYDWSIVGGNGNVTPTSFTGLIYTFTFNDDAAGVYTVTLEVTDDEGNTDSEFATINVGANPPPVAVATATPSFCQAPCNITLDGSDSYDPDVTNVITAYSWTISGPDSNCAPSSSASATWVLSCNSNAAGVYDAELEVTDDDGLTDTVTISVFIDVNPPPVAVLDVSPTSCTLTGASPSCTVTADGSNSYDPDNTTGGISNYAFDCDGDGTPEFSGSTNNVVCTYTTPGTYVLILTVTDDDTPSQTDTDSQFVTVLSNPPPVAVIESDRTQGGEPLTVAFTGLSSFDPDDTNTITAYSWDFNDTGTGPEDPADCTDVDSTAASPAHTFPEVGTYLVCLTVTDDEGLTNTAHLQIIVGGSDIPPVAVLNASPTFGDAPLTVAFDATGSGDPDNTDPPAGIVLYEYCFDSAASPTDCSAWASPDASGATLTSVNNTYTTNGPYIAKLRVTDDEGSTNVTSVLISVGQNPPPVADIQASPTTCILSGTSLTCPIALDACASDDPDNPGNSDGITDYSWDFNGDGDYSDASGVEFSSPSSEGSTGTTCSQTVTYILPGTYVVSVRVTDDDGAVTGGPFTDVATTFVTIIGNPNPVARVDCSPTAAVAPFNFVCNGGDSFDPDPTNVITAYSWSVNTTGLSSGSVTPTSGSGVIFSASVSDDAAGTFFVTLTVTDDELLTDTEDVNFVVNGNPPPIAAATASPSFCTAPCNITLDGSGSSDPDDTNVITSHQWGITGPDTNYSVPVGVTSGGPADPPCTTASDPATFAINFNSDAAGVYTAELAVCDDDTLSDTVSISMYINVNPPPVAIFSCDITTGITPFTVSCDASASYDPDNGPPGEGITEYRWDFTFHDTNNTVGCDANYPTASSHINLGGDCDLTTSTADEGTGDFNTLPNTDDSEGARTGNIVTFTYSDSGLYTILLKVTDDDGTPGNIGMASLVMTARDQPPSATIDVDPIACPAGPGVPCTFTLRANNSKDPDSATSPLPRYEWDFDYPNPLASNDPDHLTNLDFCYRTGTPFTVDAVGTQVEFATEIHGIHIIALRVTDNDDQPWANDPDNDLDNAQDNHACASVSVLVKNPDFPPTVKVDIARDLTNTNTGLVRNAPWPENQDNPLPGWGPEDQALPNDDEFLANPGNCDSNQPGCVQLAIWVEDPGILGPTMTVAIDWDADGDDTTQNFEYALCTIDPALSGDVVSSSNSGSGTVCIPHPTLNPDVSFSPFDSFLASDGVTYFNPPIFTYTTSGRHHIIVLACDASNPDDPLANCSEGDKTIESLKLHPAVEINYFFDPPSCASLSSPPGSASLDSTCVVNTEVLWNDPDGPPLGVDCPTCVVEVDCDFSDANGNNNGTLEWPDHLGNPGDFSVDFSSDQTGEVDHIESDATCTYIDPTRGTYVVVTRFFDDDSPVANIATATTTVVIRSDPPTIEILHSENDTTFNPDGGYDPDDDLVGNPNTLWRFQICADDSDDGSFADAYAPVGGGADITLKWFFVNVDALPGPDGNDPVGSPFGYGDDSPNFGPGFDFAGSSTSCFTISQAQYPNQGRYVVHVRVLDDECHLNNANPQVDCDADNDGVPEPDNPAVNIGVNASDAWLTLIIVDEPPVIWGDFYPSSDPPSIDPTLEAVQALTGNVFSLHFDAVDPDGGTVRVYYNRDSNTATDAGLARPDTTAHRTDQYSAGTNPTDPITCTNDPAGPFPANWDGFVDDTTPGIDDIIGPFSYSVPGRFCVRLMALDDEESAAVLADPVTNAPDHPSFATFMLVVVSEPPALAVRVDDDDTTSNYGLNSAFDAVGVIGTTFTFRVFADDPDGIQNPAADTLTVACSPVANVPAAVGAAADFAEAGGNEDQWTLTPILADLGANGRITCTFTYTDDEGSVATAKATILVVQSPPTVDAQVWDDNDLTQPPCDNVANNSAACRDAVSGALRFYTLYVRGSDPDNLQAPAADDLLIDCPTIDTDPGVGTTALSQAIANPLFTDASPIEGFASTERVNLDGDSTALGTQAFTADQAGQHTCRIIYCDDEDSGACGDSYPAPVFGTPPSCNDGASPDTPPFLLSEACALVTITIQGNTSPTALIDVRPEATNSPAVFQPGTHRRASSGFTDRDQAPVPPPILFGPETNRFVFRASIFDQDEGQRETDCTYYGGGGCPGFSFAWDLNNDGFFETVTGLDPEVSVVYCDAFVNGAAAGTNWAAATGNTDPGTPAGACGNNSAPDQKLIKVGMRVTDDEGQTNTAWQTIALHDTSPWAEIDVDNSGGNDLLVPNNSIVDIQLNGNDPDSPSELMLYEFECGDDVAFDEFVGAVNGGTTQNLSITYGSVSTCVVGPGSSVTGTLRITDEEGNVRTATTTISINNAAGSPPGVEIVVDATSNPLLDLNVCYAPCPVSATIFWEDTVGAGNVNGTVTWGDGNISVFGPFGFVGSTTQTNTFVFPGVFTVTASITDSDANTRTATSVQVVLDRAPSVDIDVLDLNTAGTTPAGSPGPAADPRDNADILIVTPGVGTVTLRADRNTAGTALDDDTYDYEMHPTLTPPPPSNEDATTNFQFDWWCDVNGDGIAQGGELQSATNLTAVTYGPFPVGSTLRRCLLRLGDDERGGLNGYVDPIYTQPFGLCGAETAGVACPANVSLPAGFAWVNDTWSSEAEISIVVRDDPPSAYILENTDGPPAGADGYPTPSLDDLSGDLGLSFGACAIGTYCYSVDFNIYGLDPDGQAIDRLVDCADDGTFEQRPFDQTTAFVNGNATCSYTSAGRYRLRVRNITDVTDSDPTNNPGAQGDALVTVVILDLPPTAYIAELPGADGPPAGDDGDPSETFDDWTGTVPPNYTVDFRAWGIDGDTTIGANDVDRWVDCDGAGGAFGFVSIADDVTTSFTDGTCVYTTVGTYEITLRVMSDPQDADPAPPATNAACDANSNGGIDCADAFGQVVIFNWVPSASIEEDNDDATGLFGAPPLSVFLDDGTDHSIDLDGGNITCRWDCDNDGTFEAQGSTGTTCPDLNGIANGDVTCTYAVSGAYIARIVVEDDEFAAGDTSSRSTATASIVVFDKPPSADIDEDIGTQPPAASDALAKAENWNNPLWLYAAGGPGAPITLSGMGADEGAGAGNNVYCSWITSGPAAMTFIDPITNELCSFAAPDQQDFEASVAGFYTVTLTVTDDEDNDLSTLGNQSNARYPLVVYDYDPTISVKAAQFGQFCPPLGPPDPTELVNGFNGFGSPNPPFDPFCFYTDNLSSPDGDPILNVTWDFDWSDAPTSGGNSDGILNEADCDGSGGGGSNTAFTYAAVGQYRVCAIVTDSTGNSSFAHLTVEVNDDQSDGKPSDPYVNVNCQETPPVDPVVPLPFPPCPADDPTCAVRDPTLVDTNPAVFTCDAFADDPDDRTLGHQDPSGPDLAGSPHQSEEDGDPAGPDIVRYCWYIWEITDAKTPPHTAFDPHQSPIADCDNEIVPDLDDLDTRTPVLRFVNTGSYYMEAHVFDEGNTDGDNFCDLDITANIACVDGNCDTDVLSAAETNCAVGSITIFVTEQRPAAALHKLDPSYGWPEGTSGFWTEVIGKTACLPPSDPNRLVGFHWSWGDGAFFGDDNPGYVCDPPLQELHSNSAFHQYVSPGQFYILLSVRDIDTQAESQATSTVVGTDWPIFP